MTLQMALLEERMEGEERGRAQGLELGRNEGREAVAVKLIRRGRPFEEIHEDTGLSLQRIEELAKNTSVS